MGGSTAGKSVTKRSAMQMTAVYACVRILAEAIAGLPLHLYRYTDMKSLNASVANDTCPICLQTNLSNGDFAEIRTSGDICVISLHGQKFLQVKQIYVD